jgi:hypothetical protein
MLNKEHFIIINSIHIILIIEISGNRGSYKNDVVGKAINISLKP